MENLGWGLMMTGVGMGLVFAMLALLWGLLNLVLRLDSAPVVEGADIPVSPGPDEGDEGQEVVVEDVATGQGMHADLLAAITIAVLTHRAIRRREAAPMMRSYWPGSLLYASRWVGTGRARQNYGWRRRGK